MDLTRSRSIFKNKYRPRLSTTSVKWCKNIKYFNQSFNEMTILIPFTKEHEFPGPGNKPKYI